MHMENDPESVNGYKVEHIARFAPDTSQRQNIATVVINTGADVPAPYLVWDIACNDGDMWEASNGFYDLTAETAQKRFNDRIRQRNKMRDLACSGDVGWMHFTLIRWAYVPVTGRDEFDIWALTAASKARNFAEFYKAENRAVQMAIEGYLNRWTDHHRHPSARG